MDGVCLLINANRGFDRLSFVRSQTDVTIVFWLSGANETKLLRIFFGCLKLVSPLYQFTIDGKEALVRSC